MPYRHLTPEYMEWFKREYARLRADQRNARRNARYANDAEYRAHKKARRQELMKDPARQERERERERNRRNARRERERNRHHRQNAQSAYQKQEKP